MCSSFISPSLSTLGKTAVVIGRSHNVGLPAHILLSADASKGGLELTTTLCHRHTPPLELARAVSRADLVVSAAGVGGLVTRDMMRPGAVVIDVGLSRREGRLVGDCDPGVREVSRTLYMSPQLNTMYIAPGGLCGDPSARGGGALHCGLSDAQHSAGRQAADGEHMTGTVVTWNVNH